MNKPIQFCLIGGILTVLACSQPIKIEVLPAHAHNDYVHKHPLQDALDCNFKSFEADVFSIDDSLFVAHDFEDINPGRTLRQLYLEPIKNRIKKNNGSVYGNGEEVILFIDIKDDGLKTYKMDKPQRFAIQQVYNDDRSLDEIAMARNNDVVLVPEGYHPVVAGHGYNVYYLNFLTGSDQSLANTDDPDHQWIYHSWKGFDARIPMVTAEMNNKTNNR